MTQAPSPEANDFAESLEWSHLQEDQPWWGEVYGKAFRAVSMESTRTNLTLQRQGIDRKIELASGRTIYVDEKVRSRAWDDIAIEFRNEYPDGHVEPGWIAKDLHTDYLAYAFAPTGECHVLPFQTLQRAWERHYLDWLPVDSERELSGMTFSDQPKGWRRERRIVAARNPKLGNGPLRYHTISVGVPKGLLHDHLRDAMQVSFQPS